VKPEAQRDRGAAPRVWRRIDHRHHGVHVLVGVANHPPEERQVDGVGAGYPGGVMRRRCMMDRDDPRTEAMSLPREPLRAPEGVVENDHVGPDPAQGLLRGTGPERNAVAVGGDEAQRPQLMHAAAVALATCWNEHVMLDGAGRLGEPRPLVEVGANTAAALAVEEGNVGDHEALPAGHGAVHDGNGAAARSPGR
jgi:hypothetical protein